MNGIRQGQERNPNFLEKHNYVVGRQLTTITTNTTSTPSYETSYQQQQPLHSTSNSVSQHDTTTKQQCTRCKRWKEQQQFKNDDPTLPIHAGCLECRESARKYGQSEYGRATRRNYNQTDKAKETRKKYAQSEKGKESRRKYAQTEKAKEVRRKYNQSEKAKETRKKRALIKSGRRRQVDTKTTDDEQFDLMPALIGNITFDHSQESNNESQPIDKAFWQTVSRTLYDKSRAHYDKYLDDLGNFEVDIRFKYRRTK
ncbi:hypothetical protein BC941DRAFT_407268 [Chlamydoabsidia padenii]|nr:hypothetical protein BC941DRAFT_407268 [Chlamydoabsidia padenii]